MTSFNLKKKQIIRNRFCFSGGSASGTCASSFGVCCVCKQFFQRKQLQLLVLYLQCGDFCIVFSVAGELHIISLKLLNVPHLFFYSKKIVSIFFIFFLFEQLYYFFSVSAGCGVTSSQNNSYFEVTTYSTSTTAVSFYFILLLHLLLQLLFIHIFLTLQLTVHRFRFVISFMQGLEFALWLFKQFACFL